VLRKTFNITYKVTLLAVLSAMLSLMSFLLWVSLAPRSLPLIDSVLLQSLNALLPGYSVSTSGNELRFDRDEYAFRLELQDVIIKDSTGELISRFPRVAVGYSLIAALYGDLTPSRVILFSPSFRLVLPKPVEKNAENIPAVSENSNNKPLHDGRVDTDIPPEVLSQVAIENLQNITANIGEEEKITPAANEVISEDKTDVQDFLYILQARFLSAPRRLHLVHKQLTLRNATLYVEGPHTTGLWQIPSTDISEDWQDGNMFMLVRSDVDFGNHVPTHFAGVFSSNVENKWNLSLRFDQLPTDPFQSLLAAETNFPFSFAATIDGVLSLTLSEDLIPEKAELEVSKLQGSLDAQKWFQTPLVSNDLALNVAFFREGEKARIVLNEMKGHVNNLPLDVSGEVSGEVPQEWQKWQPKVNLSAATKSLDFLELMQHWPETVGPFARHWVLAHIKSAQIDSLICDLSLEEGNWHKALLSEGALHTVANFRELKSDYFPGLPAIENAEGVLTLVTHFLDINVAKAKVGNSDVTDLHLVIDQFYQWPSILEIEGKSQGPIADAIPFMPHSSVEALSEQGIDIENSAALLETSLRVTVPLHEKVAVSEIGIDGEVKISDANFPKLFGRYSAKKAQILLNLDYANIALSGNALLDEVPVVFSAESLPRNKNGLGWSYKIDASLNKAQLANFTAGADINFENSLAVNLSGVFKGAEHLVKGKIDLKKTSFSLPWFAFQKPADANSELIFDAAFVPDKNLNIKQFSWIGTKHQLSGSLSFQEKNMALKELYLEQSRIGDQRIEKVQLLKTADTDDVIIESDSLNLEKISFDKLFSENDPDRKKNLDISVRKLTLKQGEVLKDVKLLIICGKKRCEDIQIDAQFDDANRMKGRMFDVGSEKPHFEFFAANAGRLLRTLDIFTHMHGGDIKISAAYSDNAKSKSGWNGVLEINNFHVKNAPVLARILTLASFSGLGELLGGEGLNFRLFQAPFNLNNKRIEVLEAKSSGASMGVTMAGSIDLNQQQLSLDGTLIPANVINSVVGAIPLLGNVLAGGKDKGLIAANYQVFGSFADPQVTVNPLSLLTPGFLRHIFDVFSEPSAVKNTNNKKQKNLLAAEEEQKPNNTKQENLR
jgi:hypothetical protein